MSQRISVPPVRAHAIQAAGCIETMATTSRERLIPVRLPMAKG